MAKYVFPAVFTKEDEGYSVHFPDIKNCFTSGVNLIDAMDMAKDALCLMLYDMEESGEHIPEASQLQDISVEQENELVSLISCDTVEYRKFFDNKAIKKTLTIPNWLNTIAEREGVNFSQLLQSALVEKLGLN